jgi:S1-C subfamily serine protease
MRVRLIVASIAALLVSLFAARNCVSPKTGGAEVDNSSSPAPTSASNEAESDVAVLVVPPAIGGDAGIWATVAVSVDGDELSVVNAREGGPAFRAGIRDGDVLMELDGVALLGRTFDDSTRRLSGAEGSTVRIKVRRGNEPPFVVEAVRKLDV